MLDAPDPLSPRRLRLICRALAAGWRDAPDAPLGPAAGPLEGMRPVFVLTVLLPLTVAALAVWAEVAATAVLGQ